MFAIATTFERDEVAEMLAERFRVPTDDVDRFFHTLRTLNVADDPAFTTRDLFERLFPGARTCCGS